MSFALQPTDGHARLLGPPPAQKAAAGAEQPKLSQIQGAVQTVQGHISALRKETGILNARRGHAAGNSSAQQVKQFAIHAVDILKEARRSLTELESAAERDAARNMLQGLTLKKLSESIETTALELERGLAEFKSAEASWTRRQAALMQEGGSAASAGGGEEDVEAGRLSAAQVHTVEDVAQGQVDMHEAMVEEFTQDLSRVATNVRSMHQLMADLADHARSQGEVLDSIEANMGQVEEKAEQATEELQKTEQTQRRRMKSTACLLLTVLVVSGAAIATSLWQ